MDNFKDYENNISLSDNNVLLHILDYCYNEEWQILYSLLKIHRIMVFFSRFYGKNLGKNYEKKGLNMYFSKKLKLRANFWYKFLCFMTNF